MREATKEELLEDIKELERERTALLKTQEFHLELIKELEEQLKEKH